LGFGLASGLPIVPGALAYIVGLRRTVRTWDAAPLDTRGA
jgi:hypothetical protein